MEYIDRIVDVPVVAQRQVSTIQTVEKTVDVPQVQLNDRVVDATVMVHGQVPMPQTMEEIMEVIQLTPQERTPERIVDETAPFHM